MRLTAQQFAHVYLDLIEKHPEKTLEELAYGFASFLKEQHQLFLWRDIVAKIHLLWKKKNGISEVHITTAAIFPKEQQIHLAEQIKGADIQMHVDPNLIAGTIIRVDDRLIDGSVRGQLERMKQVMLTNNHYV